MRKYWCHQFFETRTKLINSMIFSICKQSYITEFYDKYWWQQTECLKAFWPISVQCCSTIHHAVNQQTKVDSWIQPSCQSWASYWNDSLKQTYLHCTTIAMSKLTTTHHKNQPELQRVCSTTSSLWFESFTPSQIVSSNNHGSSGSNVYVSSLIYCTAEYNALV